MNKTKIFILSALIGVIIGAVNGFMGGGGGMICVPALMWLLKFNQKTAHASAMFVILPLSVVSAVIYFLNNNIEIWHLISVSGGVLIGGIIGALLLKKLPEKVTSIVFVILMFLAGLKLII